MLPSSCDSHKNTLPQCWSFGFQMMSLVKGQESAAEICELWSMHCGFRSIYPPGVVPKDGWRCGLQVLAQGLSKFGRSIRLKPFLAC